MKIENWYLKLNDVDVSKNVKQKNGLSYLSWMWSWKELKKRYPLSYSTVHETEDGMLVWRDPIGAHVKTSVTIVWEEDGELKEHTVTEYLPCMDFKNKAVPYENIDSMIVNKTIQRSLTKCIARLGLGDYLFAGEDLPESVSKLKDAQDECYSVIEKKCALSANAKKKVAELCKAAEKEFDPELPDDAVTGNPYNIKDIDIITKLKKQIMAIRK